MKDKTLPDKEIVKALECCSSQPQELCCNCPIDIRKIKGGCITALTTYAIDLINRLQAEKENLKDILYDGEGVNLVNYWHQQCKIAENGCKNFSEENKNLKAEIERLKNRFMDMERSCHNGRTNGVS